MNKTLHCWHFCHIEINSQMNTLTHWGRVTHTCVRNLAIIGSDNGLSLDRRQAITWTNAGILLIGPLGTNFSEILIKIHAFSFKQIQLKKSAKQRPFCLSLDILKSYNVSIYLIQSSTRNMWEIVSRSHLGINIPLQLLGLYLQGLRKWWIL